MEKKRISTRTLTGMALLTAVVVILQCLGAFIRFGLVFGLVVLLSGDASAFLVVSPLGTILTVLLKGSLAGLCAGLVYKSLSRSETKVRGVDLAVIAAAVVCPVVNTGVFLLGCLAFFMPTISEWAAGMGFESVGRYMIFGLVGGNFLFELLYNIILSPIIVRLIRIGRNRTSA